MTVMIKITFSEDIHFIPNTRIISIELGYILSIRMKERDQKDLIEYFVF